jgi:predicted dehydrogenase
MLNLRVEPRFRALRRMVSRGELGTLRRINWITTDWFRTEAYYRSGGWRATWRGEGGGVLLNQCPHILDLWQWLFGMPARVHAFCGFGRFHDIEVEDQVTAYLEYESGMTGVFVASTGEAPGTSRLEVVGDLGRAVLEGDRLTVTQNASSAMDWLRHSPERGAMPATETRDDCFPRAENPRAALIGNFVSAILEGDELIAPASDGLASVELANAMILSTLQRQTIDLPLDPALYARELARLVDDSRVTRAEG